MTGTTNPACQVSRPANKSAATKGGGLTEPGWPSSMLGELLALRRVAKGTVFELGGAFYSAGRAFPPWLVPHLFRLLAAGDVQRDLQETGIRITLSARGQARLAEDANVQCPDTAPPDTRPAQPEGRSTMWEWAPLAIVAVIVIIRVIAHADDRPAREPDRPRHGR